MTLRRLTFLLRIFLPLLLGIGWKPAAAAPAPRTAAATPLTSATQSRRDPGFHLSLDLNEAHIGDTVKVRLEVRDPQITPERIEGVEFAPDAEKWHLEAPFHRDWTDQGKKPGPWQSIVRPFDTGTLAIPPLKVTYHDASGTQAAAYTTTATLKVLGLRPANSQSLTLIGMRDPAEIPRDWSGLITAAVVLALCALAVWAGLRWWSRRKIAAIISREPELPPGLWALRELDHRSRLPVCQNGPAKPIFSHVSEVVRLYLGRRYGVSAIDMTTFECLQALHSLHLGSEVLCWIRDFLDECDLVKFTTIEPSRERWQTIWHDARLIVKMTTPQEELGENVNGAREREVAV